MRNYHSFPMIFEIIKRLLGEFRVPHVIKHVFVFLLISALLFPVIKRITHNIDLRFSITGMPVIPESQLDSW